MLTAAEDAVRCAQADGVSRQLVRVLLPSPRVDGLLVPADESWEGGIMQLYQACKPLGRELVARLSPGEFGKRPRIKEQRVDESGVDGEGLITSECEFARDDVSLFVQPSLERLKAIRAVAASAGPRLVVLMNPQYRDSDDTLDFLTKQGGNGLLGKVATFLGGKGAFVAALENELGFQPTFVLEQFVVRGSELKYLRAYPGKWAIYLTGDDGDPFCIGESSTRPDYNKVDRLMEAGGVQQKALRDLKKATPLTAATFTLKYTED